MSDVELPPIEHDKVYDRDYIPLPGGWEVQTKGRGSTFRVCDTKSGERMPVVETMLHPWLERMAREVRAATAALAQQRVPDAETAKLVEFFRKEGYMRFGLNGDNMGWSPAETAIRAMREYMSKEAKGFLTDDISVLPDVWRAYVKERRFEIGELVEDAVKACANDLESALIDAQYNIAHR